MKVLRISYAGARPARPSVVTTQRGRYFALHHGEEGRGRWEYRLPLAARDFPPPASADGHVEEKIRDALAKEEFRLISLGKSDAKGNPLFLLVKGQEDGAQLILWELSPGFRGGAQYHVEGQAKVIAEGYEAQGDAGRMGGAPCPVVLVTGPCRLTWHRSGRLYGSPADWVAEFDGETWTVSPVDECVVDEAALTY